MGSGLYSHTTRSSGTVLTAAIYNADHLNHITNHNTEQMDDYSTSVAQMRATADPGEDGTESQATSLAGEVERLRFIINEIIGKTYWYETPATDLESITEVADVFTTRGDILYRNATVPARLAIGANSTVLQSDGTDPLWATVPYPVNYLSGGNVTINATDADHDVDIAEIHFRNSDDDLNFDTTSTFVKQIDATFAKGSAAGGLVSSLSGTPPTSGTLYLFAVTEDSSGDEDFMLDDSATGANINAGWTKQESHAVTTNPYLAIVTTDGSANIAFISNRHVSPLVDIPQATTSGTSKTFTAPSTGIKEAIVTLSAVQGDGTEELIIQVGDSGGTHNSGYVSLAESGSTRTGSTAGFIIVANGAASDSIGGSIRLSLHDSSHTWVSSGSLRVAAAQVSSSGGTVTLDTELTTIVLTFTGTPDDFVAGSVNVTWILLI